MEAVHARLGRFRLYCNAPIGTVQAPNLLFTENETNHQKLFNVRNSSSYVKDGINNYIVNGQVDAVNPEQVGTKSAVHYMLDIDAGETQTIQLRLYSEASENGSVQYLFGDAFDTIFHQRQQEADEFYQRIAPSCLCNDRRNVQR